MFGVWCRIVAALAKRLGQLSVIVAAICNAPTANAQSLPPPPELKNPSVGANLGSFFTSKTPYEFWLSCLICLFGLAVIYALLFGMRRSHNARPEDIARPIIIVTVITGTLMLITCGYNNEQIAPAFGLFGTIVGYMLGRFAQPQPSPEAPPQPPDKANT